MTFSSHSENFVKQYCIDLDPSSKVRPFDKHLLSNVSHRSMHIPSRLDGTKCPDSA